MTNLIDAVRHLEAGDWQAAHAIVQEESTPLACWAHGIVHLMEGDRANADYWYRRATRTAGTDPDISAEIAALRRAVEASGT